jgi:hypothetical protein
MESASLGSAVASLFQYQSTRSDGIEKRGLTPVEGAQKHCRQCRETPAAESAATLRYRRTERTALYIETQEGDLVRLKIKVRDSLTANAGQDGDTTVADTELNGKSSVKIRFSVEGDLNADELAAIRSVVEQASALAEEFFAGDLTQAFAAAQSLEFDGAELARVGLRLSVRESLTYSAAGTYRPVPTTVATSPSALPAPAPAEQPAEPAAIAAPSTVAEPEATTAPVASEPVEAPGSEAPATPPASDPVAPSRDVASQALAAIADFVAQLLESLTEAPVAEDGASAASIELSLKVRIFQSIVLNVAPTQAPESPSEGAADGLPLVADTLDALAAAEQPIDAHA